MQVHRSTTESAVRPPEATFTGDVRISGYVRRAAPSELTCAVAHYAPGARSPWKRTPRGQTLVVTGGAGWARQEGEEVVEVCRGDVVWCPPGVRHWEGAAADTAMTCAVLQEGAVDLGESVTDDEYAAGSAALPTEDGATS